MESVSKVVGLEGCLLAACRAERTIFSRELVLQPSLARHRSQVRQLLRLRCASTHLYVLRPYLNKIHGSKYVIRYVRT